MNLKWQYGALLITAILFFIAGMVWANRNLQARFDYAVTFGQYTALWETDSCVSQAKYADTGPDGVSRCIHEIAETEHFDKRPTH
jgi:hypothetical protein